MSKPRAFALTSSKNIAAETKAILDFGQKADIEILRGWDADTKLEAVLEEISDFISAQGNVNYVIVSSKHFIDNNTAQGYDFWQAQFHELDTELITPGLI